MVTICKVRRRRHDDVPDVILIIAGEISVGTLIYHNTLRYPDDPCWTVDTIGL